MHGHANMATLGFAILCVCKIVININKICIECRTTKLTFLIADYELRGVVYDAGCN